MKRKLKITLLALLGAGIAAFAWLWFAPCGLGGCAPVSELEKFQAEGSELLDVRGRPFGTLATVNRRVVPLDSLPDYLPRAFLAVEDRRFYEHGGVDWKRVAGALFTNVKSGGVAEGGSTITMQLARNLFPEALPYRERSLRRKVMEIRVARQIERKFDKRKILELYLNHIYLGQGAYGVDAAARAYFGKPAAQLTVAEAAVLGGLPISPTRINPREDRDAARRRRDLVLREMARAGYITAAQADSAIAEPIVLARAQDRGPRAGYFVERVRRELEERVGERFYTEGLRVFTTFDPDAQAAAEHEVSRQLAAIESGQFGPYQHPVYAKGKAGDEGETAYLQGLAVVMDARTGGILALVGGRDYDDSKFDRVFQAKRQPGSAFKPFVYLAALQRGIPPTQTYDDQPVRITLARNRTWSPRNFNGAYDGQMTLREALTRSKNTITVRVAQEVGMGTVIQEAHRLGVESDIPDVPAAALGAAVVRPIELVGAYAVFANGGARVEPHVLRRIEDRHGNVVWEEEAAREEVLDPAEAFVLTSLLRDVVDRGTGSPVRAAGFHGPAAGKTGTTNAATDVWFVGYTPDLVGAVWFGLDRPQTIVRGASGGMIAAPVWGRIMSRVYQSRRAPLEWQPPRGVVTEQVDRASGQPVDPACPGSGQTYTEYFVNVRPPRPLCSVITPYPAMAMDTAWQDDEAWDTAYEPDTVGMSDLEQRGVYWPELEERRRREAEGKEVAPIAPPPPASPASPPSQSRRTPIVVSAEPPAATSSGLVEGEGGSEGGTGETTRPASTGSSTSGRAEPKLLGQPAGGGGTPPDTTSTQR